MTDASRKPKIRKVSLAYIDDLTGLYNRRFLEIARKECDEFQEKNIPFSVAIIDIDHFKRINDTYGHPKGDEVIREFAKFMKINLRASDIVIRYGGDEFLCVMVNAEAADVHRVYDRLLTRCREQRFGKIEVMISAGLASFPGDGRDFDQLLKLADESLYDAKRSGRGRLGVVRKKRIDLPTKIFIGRVSEIEVLSRFIHEARVVRAGVIEGNIGIGKTRFTKEVISNLRGYEVLWSDCLAFFEGISYYPIRELIKYKISQHGNRIIKDIPLAYRIELGKLIPELMEGVKEKVSEIGLVLDKYRLYESIKRVLEYGNKPKVIVIDNMQWADLDTTETIKYLLRSLADQGVIFFFIYRQEERTKVLEEFTSYISRDTQLRELRLGALELNEVKEMLRLIINEEPSEELAMHVAEGSGGNPLYIEELIKGLSDGGYLVLDGDHWRFLPPGKEVVPKSIEDITERKYQELSAEGKQVLEIASVIGWFDIEILRGITGYNEGHIIGVLDRLQRLGLIRERGERVEFQDEVSRNTVYKLKVSGLKGRSLHKQVGDWLERRYQGREIEVLEELALHYYRGGERDKGIRYCLEAGDRVREKYANQSAISYYTWAEELLRDQTDIESKKKRIDCLLRRVDVLNFIGNKAGALKDLEFGLKLANEIHDKSREANMRYAKAVTYYQVSHFNEALDEATGSLSTCKEIGDKQGIARALTISGSAHFGKGEVDKAFRNFEDALAISKEIADKRFATRLLNNLAGVYFYRGNYDKALGLLEDSLKISKQLGDRITIAISTTNLASMYRIWGDYKKASQCLDDSLKLCRAIGARCEEANALDFLSQVNIDWADYDEALKYGTAALKIFSDIDNKYGQARGLITLGTIYMNWGDYERASEYFADSLSISQGIGSNEYTISSLLSIGSLYIIRGALEKAKSHLDKAYNMAKQIDSKRVLMETLLVLSIFYLEKKNFKDFETYLKMLEDLQKELNLKKFDNDISFLKGRYYAALKKFEPAYKYLNAALKNYEELNEQMNVGQVYYYSAIMEFAQGNQRTGRKYLKQAQKIFVLLKAKGWKQRVAEVVKPVK